MSRPGPAQPAAGCDDTAATAPRYRGEGIKASVNVVLRVTPPSMPLQWAFNTATSLSSSRSLLRFLSGDKLQPESYMWSFYSNPVASVNSSVNFPTGCLTKREKQKNKKKQGVGIRLTLRGRALLLELVFYLLNYCRRWTVKDQWEPMTALDRLGELTHILFFGFKRLRGEKPRWKAGKVCVRTSRHVTSSQEVHREDAANSQQSTGKSSSLRAEDRPRPALLMSPWQQEMPNVGGTHTQPRHWWASEGAAHTAGNPAAFRLWLWLQRSVEMSVMCPWTHMLRPGLHNLTWPLQFSRNQKQLNRPLLLMAVGIGSVFFCIKL